MPYTTITEPTEAEYVEKKSRFIAHLAPVTSEQEAFSFIHNIKSQHRMARHNVHAFIVQEDDGGLRVRFSDDGEPAKTAGLPVLQALQGFNMINVCCVVTRYFGGILLGTGGLVRAYSTATKAALDSACLQDILECNDIHITLPYSLIGSVEHAANAFTLKKINQIFNEQVCITYRIAHDECDHFLRKLDDIGNGTFEISVSDVVFAAL